ncbi:jg13289 [Pararge aegeria aegeria]|uniref:Jg13289 protein n=1 Tax=Pararge aegeria aegeria TaxID=348720 RepID=A0A8S4RDT1_9NEOP|nr:jg13289 [Pararge aegeria aegeria]
MDWSGSDSSSETSTSPLAGPLNAQATGSQGSRVKNLLTRRAVSRTTAFCIRPLIQQPSERFFFDSPRRKDKNVPSPTLYELSQHWRPSGNNIQILYV